mgnify:CR=1 FL=1
MLQRVNELDRELFLYLNNLGNENWDMFWLLVTDKWTAIPLYLVLLYLLFKKFGWRGFLLTIVVIALLITATDQLGNVFKDGELALEYLINTDTEPFIIFSDINMPRLNGVELREKVHNNEDLRMKSIPYLFFTTSAEQKAVVDAYSKSIQGFFIKPVSYDKLKKTIKIIVEYWQECVSPNYIK